MFVTQWLNRIFANAPAKDILIFESSPDYACNTEPVFRQLRQDLPDYRMVWYASKDSPVPDGVDDVYCYDDGGFLNLAKTWYYTHFARAFVSSNRIMEKKRPVQYSLFLCHGSKTKKTRGVYEVGEGVDFINVQSHFFDDIVTYEYNCDPSRLVYLGYPRCDRFFDAPQKRLASKEKLGLAADTRCLVWLPTFRKHANPRVKGQMDTSKYGSIGMPLVYDRESLKRLDDFLVQSGTVLYYKPHPAQDVSGLVHADTRAIRMIRDSDLSRWGVSLYELLAVSDGLITDYSSVFFDYLLADKPIVTTTDDMEEWKKMTGFAFDLDAFLEEATTRTATLEELMAFLRELFRGKDEKAAGRKRIRELTNTYFDGDSAKRVAAFIKEKIGA